MLERRSGGILNVGSAAGNTAWVHPGGFASYHAARVARFDRLEEVIGDGVALAGVAQYPARVKCALLGWMALTDALARAGVDVSTTSQGESA